MVTVLANIVIYSLKRSLHTQLFITLRFSSCDKVDRTEQGDEPTKHAYTVPHSLRLVPPCTTPSAVLSTVHAFHRMYILSHGPSVEVPKYPMTDTHLSNLLPGPPVPFIEQAPDTSAAIVIDEFTSFHSDKAGCPCNTSSRRGASHGVNLDRFRWLRLILPIALHCAKGGSDLPNQ